MSGKLTRVGALVVGTVLMTGTAFPQLSEYATPTLDPEHSFNSVIPEETVDLFTGALILSYTDVRLPGPAGFDLELVRWYNSKINTWEPNCLDVTTEETFLGVGWQMHLGRLWDNPTSPVPERQPEYRLDLPRGESREFYGNPSIPVPNGALVSKDFWILRPFVSIDGVNHHVVISPSGVEYRFKTGSPNPFNLGELGLFHYLTSKVDSAGNAITISYTSPRGDGKPYPGVVTDALGRTVTFVYDGNSPLDDPAPLQKVRVKNTAGVLVDYLYDVGGDSPSETLANSAHQGLLKVTTPTGLETTYSYTPRAGEDAGNDVELKKVTLPSGQILEYYYLDHVFQFPLQNTGQGQECTRVLSERRVQGVGNWVYDYPTGSAGDDTTIATDPLGNEERAEFARYQATGSDKIWKVGLLTRREIEDPGEGILRIEEYDYSPFEVAATNVCPQSGCTEFLQAALLTESRVTVSGNGSSKTSKSIHGDYDDYGNPGFVEEYGFLNDLIRETEFTYAHGPGEQWNPTSTYIVDRPARVTRKDAVGVVKADQTFMYYTTNASPGAKGQLQQTQQWANAVSDFAAGAKWLTTNFEYAQDAGGSTGSGDISKSTVVSTAGNRVTTYIHEWGNLKSATDGEGGIFTRVINQHTGLVMSQSDPNAQATAFTYDAMGRMTSIDPPVGQTTSIAYDNATGKSVTATMGPSETRYEFDGLGRQVLTRRLLTQSPLVRSFNRVAYDALGRVVTEYEASTTDPIVSAPGVRRTYDALGRVLSSQDPDGTTTYDYGPDTVTSTNPFTHTKTTTTDALGRLKQVVDEAGHTTVYGYDVNDQLLTVNHPGGANPDRSRSVNSLGWLLNEANPESGLTRYAYNDFGELSQRQDGALKTKTMGYDARGRLKTVAHGGGPTFQYFYDGDPVPGTGTVTYTNALGNRTGMLDGLATTLWTSYDTVNRPLTKKTILAGWVFNESLSYDTRGNIETRTYPQLEADPQTRMVLGASWNDGNKVSSLTVNTTTPVATGVLYNPAFRMREVTLGNGARVERPTTPALRNRPDQIRTVGVVNIGGGAAELVLDYGWDALGRVGTISSNGRLDTFGYDHRGQLTSVSYAGQGSVAYGYDATGNMTSRSSAAFPFLNFSRIHTGNRINGQSYDGAGNILAEGANSLTFGATGQLTTVTTPTGSVTHSYDGEGRRRVTLRPGGKSDLLFYTESGELLSKFELPTGGTPVPVEDVIYLDGERLVTRRYPEISDPGETLDVDENGTDVFLEWDTPEPCGGSVQVVRATAKNFSDAAVIASEEFDLAYTDSGQAQATGNKFYRIEGPRPTLHYHINDHLGTTRMLVDENGVVEATYEYFPFGESKFIPCPLLTGGFQGKERDPNTDQEDFGLRHYSAGLARFLTPDPSRQSMDLEQPHSWNRYAFSLNNPMGYVDPDGGEWQSWVRVGASLTLSGIKNLTPIGNIIDGTLDLGSAAFGVDLITGQKLSARDRKLYLVGAFLPALSGATLVVGVKALGLLDDLGVDTAARIAVSGRGARGVTAGAEASAGALPRSGRIGLSLGAMSRAERLARKHSLNVNSATTRQVLNSLDDRVTDFIARYRNGKIYREFPTELLQEGVTVEQALEHSYKVRKLLTAGKFAKGAGSE